MTTIEDQNGGSGANPDTQRPAELAANINHHHVQAKERTPQVTAGNADTCNGITESTLETQLKKPTAAELLIIKTSLTWDKHRGIYRVVDAEGTIIAEYKTKIEAKVAVRDLGNLANLIRLYLSND